MAERACNKCGETYLQTRGQKICPECVGEREPQDLVTHFSTGESYRLAAGLRQRAGT